MDWREQSANYGDMVVKLIKVCVDHHKADRVVPLSQRSGVLEWCEGTQPLGDFLVDKPTAKGAHSRYRPKDWKAHECRVKMTEMHNRKENTERKLAVYLDICAHFKPVFRHFFMERFSEPAVWFQRRLAYTRSMATNSIVGYILGLGDRHVMNILVDLSTAELIHIDLGIAFEQGRILPTPETVPFRLTRDLVDGMGTSGVEGVFRRCCERTMAVMREHQEELLTLVQVLLYDPLHTWTLSATKALAVQGRDRGDRGEGEPADTAASTLGTSSSRLGHAAASRPGAASREGINKQAERVLLRLQQKLQGLEEGGQLSVAGQVNLLIQEAMDPQNLSCLFPGWQPYL